MPVPSTPTVAPAALTVADACRYSGFSRSRLYEALAAGDLLAVRAGRRTLVLRRSLDDLLAALPPARIGRKAA